MTQAAFQKKHLRVLFLRPLKTSNRLRHNTGTGARHKSEALTERQSLPVASPSNPESLCLAAITVTATAASGAALVLGRWLRPGHNNVFETGRRIATFFFHQHDEL
jgi:hypothetical protein